MLHLQELSFRVAIVYAGGLISGAFGSVGVCILNFDISLTASHPLRFVAWTLQHFDGP